MCEAKEFDNPGPLYTGPKTHAEEGATAEDGQRKPKWPRNVVEDNLFLASQIPRGENSTPAKATS